VEYALISLSRPTLKTGKKAYGETAVVAQVQAAKALETANRFHIKLNIKSRCHVLVKKNNTSGISQLFFAKKGQTASSPPFVFTFCRPVNRLIEW
jgi:hypothetical protein